MKTHAPKKHWPFLLLGLIQLLDLYQQLREYLQVKDANIFSDAAWESYRLHRMVSLTANAIFAILFLGMFFIHLFIRTPRGIQIAQGLLFLLCALILAVSGFFLNWTAQLQACGLWIVSLTLLLGCSLYILLKKKKDDSPCSPNPTTAGPISS